MFHIDKTKELTPDRVVKYIRKFRGTTLPMIHKYKNYYDGNQIILAKTYTDATKPCNKLVCNYCSDIVENYTGYMAGKPVAYTSDDDISGVIDVLAANDSDAEDKELLKQALINGVAYELNYVNEESQQRFKLIDSDSGFGIYSADLDEVLLYFVRFYSADDIDDTNLNYIDVYDATNVYHYKSTNGFKSMAFVDSTPHYYGTVPVTVFRLNKDEKSIFDKIITLQDAYNKLISATTDDWESFVDAYMILRGVDADTETLAEMKKNRILLLDEDSSADYLTKDDNNVGIDGLLSRLNKHIQRVAKSPDFNDETFMAQSGVAIRYKLVGMENMASSIESNYKAALTNRLVLINAILNKTEDAVDINAVDLIFTRNLPVNTLEAAQIVNQLRGVVSNKTLLAQLPFVQNAAKEMEAVEAETGASEVFDFGSDE